MDNLIGSCGIDCSKCDAYLATRNNNDEQRQTTAENWSKMFNATLQAKDINCLGCHSEVVFGHCNQCDIRKCNTDKAQENCSTCDSYSCDKISEFHKMVPDAKAVIEGLR
jgi:hypothetical protein